jgi:hydroxypyruvate isomerase
MPDFAANLSTMFTELPFLQRFNAAARCGFSGVEFAYPEAVPEKSSRDDCVNATLRSSHSICRPGNRSGASAASRAIRIGYRNFARAPAAPSTTPPP